MHLVPFQKNAKKQEYVNGNKCLWKEGIFQLGFIGPERERKTNVALR